MQTNLVFYTAYDLENNYKTNNKSLIINDKTPADLGNKVITFDEYNKIIVKFQSDDKNAVLEIDSGIDEEPLKLSPSEELINLAGSGYDENMLTPGYYGINIVTSSKTYNGLYFINSKTVSWDGLINLRRYLETVMSGLSQNLYIQRMAGQKNIYGDENYSLNKMYIYINNNFDNVINSIESIIRNPLTDMKKEYREQYYTKKQDIKSQRWLCTKGLNKNNNIHAPNVMFEKHSFLNENINENCYIKLLLQKSLDKILFIEKMYQSIYNNSIDIVKNEIDLYKKNEVSYNILKNDRVVDPKYKEETKNELKYLQKDIDAQQQHISFLDETLINLKKNKAILLFYIHETWLNNISYLNKNLRVSQKILKDNRYYQIYDFYLNILAIEKNDPQSRKPYFPSKSTPKLFEYYSVALVINILRNDGFIWDSGWLADNINKEIFNGEIIINKPMILTKDNLRAELVYEKEVQPNITVIKNNVSDFVRMNATHYKPDIILSLFNNETGDLEKSIVLEVKCCMSQNLQSKNGPSKAIDQVKDYCNFGYYDKNRKGKKKAKIGVIDEVIIIYPKQDKVIQYEYDDVNISFIQVEATNDTDITKHYGYEELKKEIDRCFSLSLYNSNID